MKPGFTHHFTSRGWGDEVNRPTTMRVISRHLFGPRDEQSLDAHNEVTGQGTCCQNREESLKLSHREVTAEVGID